jgi:hypothetical protein
VTQCTTNPTLAGCTVVLPPVTQVATSKPVTQAVNQTVAVINTTIPNINFLLDGGGLTSGTSSTTANPTSKNTGGNGTTPTSTNPGTTNDTAKKMYCD